MIASWEKLESAAYIELRVALGSGLERLLASFSLPLGGGAGPAAGHRRGAKAGSSAEGRAGDKGRHGAWFRGAYVCCGGECGMLYVGATSGSMSKLSSERLPSLHGSCVTGEASLTQHSETWPGGSLQQRRHQPHAPFAIFVVAKPARITTRRFTALRPPPAAAEITRSFPPRRSFLPISYPLGPAPFPSSMSCSW